MASVASNSIAAQIDPASATIFLLGVLLHLGLDVETRTRIKPE